MDGDSQTQLALDVPAARFLEIEQDERNPEFTGARFFQCHPREYQEIVALRAEAVPIATLARIYRVSRNTIAAIDERESRSVRVEQLKQHNSRAYNRLASLCRERAAELVLSLEVADLSASERIACGRVLAILMGVAEDKAQLLSGGATSRVEVSDPRASGAAFAEALARMGFRGADPAEKAVSVEVGPARPVSDQGPADGCQEPAVADLGTGAAVSVGVAFDKVSDAR
jgi:hypothetical protein